MTLIVRPGFQFDTDASTYIEAVEAADTQALETNTRYAINDFVIGCKQDGIWSAIKASCILSGARTLAGALVPLVGTAPTNVDGLFVSGDYNRKTGLVGNGSTKYLNSNRNNNADPQNSLHQSAFIAVGATGENAVIGTASVSNSGSDCHILNNTASNILIAVRNRHGGTIFSVSGNTAISGFVGSSRGSSSSYQFRYNSTSATNSVASSSSIASLNHFVFARNNNGTAQIFSAQRLAFYSIGESLDLALLDARVSALITAFGVAIP
jgi:hypothetical protein